MHSTHRQRTYIFSAASPFPAPVVAGQRRRAKRNSRPFFFPPKAPPPPPPPLGPSHFELGSRLEGLSSFRAPVHPTPAAKQSQLYRNCAARRGYRDCLPTPHPSIHPLVHYLPCLVLPACRYIPTNSISPKLRQRCAALPIPIRIPFIPSLVIPASLFSTLPSRSWRQRPERSFPDRPSTAAAPPSLQYYIYLGTPQVSRVRQLPGRARLPNSHARLPLSTRLDSTGPHLHHPPPTPTHALFAAPTVLEAVHPRPSSSFAYRGNQQTGIRTRDHIHQPGGRTSAPTRPSLASIQA